MQRQSHSERQKIDKVTIVPSSPKSFTVPNMAINPAQALKMYASGTLQKNMQVFYNDDSIPNLNSMDLLDRLALQAQYREDLESAKIAHARYLEQEGEAKAKEAIAKMKEEMKKEFQESLKNVTDHG